MQGIKIPHLIGIAALCWIALIFFQVNWIKDSRDLIEEQFDQKVSLALGTAISSLDSSTLMAYCSNITVCQPLPTSNSSTPASRLMPVQNVRKAEENPALLSAVDEALAFYDIDLDYRINVIQESTPNCEPSSPYLCAMNPFQSSEKAMLNISFPGKSDYLFKKIWWMLASSIFILLFILFVFVLALRSLIYQKRMSQWNIDFFNNMAHEFKTPLTNIRLATQRLVKKNPALANDPYINVVRNEDAKLGEQIDRVLNMATLGKGSPYLKQQKLNLQNVIRDVVTEMQLQIQAINATVTIHPSEELYQVEGDLFHLSNAFRNLIDNALKYNNSTPVIDIYFERRDDNIAMIFNDNGIGIARKNRELIFNKFHRVPHGNRHDFKGFGLGLSYVKMIIEDHHGSIKALQNIQEGSQFELILPAA
jgi:two-component system, OmpR family, phosphate regulon sensor histidine kinase PhoR